MIDPDELMALPPILTRQQLTSDAVIAYALGVGADELPFVYEEQLCVLPTMAVTLASPGFFWRDPRYGVDWTRVLHGETRVELHAPLPIKGELTSTTRFDAVADKGPDKGAIVHVNRTLHDGDGTHLATVRNASFLRSDGGCGSAGEVPTALAAAPVRRPDAQVTLAIAANQALIYRLSGDLNPLHVDPAAARAAGFERPILHGLCSFGIVGRALTAEFARCHVLMITRIGARFSAPVYPGETIVTDIWHMAKGRVAFRAHVAERATVILDNGYAEVA